MRFVLPPCLILVREKKLPVLHVDLIDCVLLGKCSTAELPPQPSLSCCSFFPSIPPKMETLSQVWWYIPILPTLPKTEAGGS